MTPEQEDQVRRALGATADADRSGPVPADVAARLDDVLADLVAPRSSPPPDPARAARLDELAARRRRTHRMLVAAAVAVIALAGGAVVARGVTSSTTAGSTSSAGHASSGATSGPAGSSAAGGSGAEATGPVPALRSATLAQDVRRVVAGASPLPSTSRPRARLVPQASGSPGAQATTCAVPARPTGGLLVAVRLDGRAATLLVSAPVQGRRTARVVSCADGSVLARTTVRDR